MGIKMFCLMYFFHRDIWRGGLVTRRWPEELCRDRLGCQSLVSYLKKAYEGPEGPDKALWKCNNTQEKWQRVSCQSWWSLQTKEAEPRCVRTRRFFWKPLLLEGLGAETPGAPESLREIQDLSKLPVLFCSSWQGWENDMDKYEFTPTSPHHHYHFPVHGICAFVFLDC